MLSMDRGLFGVPPSGGSNCLDRLKPELQAISGFKVPMDVEVAKGELSANPPLARPANETDNPWSGDAPSRPDAPQLAAGSVCQSKPNTALALNRRQFIRTGAAALATAALTARLQAGYNKLKIGATDWNLKLEAKPGSIELAKSIGLDGVQISLGHSSDPKNAPAQLPVSMSDLLEQFLAEARKSQLPIASTCLEILHRNYLKNDPLGRQWVAESIPLTKKLGARVILLPFFGKGALETRAEMVYVADFLKEIGPEAEKTGVILGLENTNSAEDNARILDRAHSKAVLVYYDVGNSFNNGFDIYKEIGWLGKDRICEFHLKDNPSLIGQGKIDFPKVIGAIVETGFSGWAQLETVAPSGDVRNDMKTNLDFVRGLLAKA
jgi:L-ribulose-5-phosphate 3-epimerase